MNYVLYQRLFAGLAVAALTGCGGGGSGGSSAGGGSVIVAPTPSPAPAPSPTPAADYVAGVGAAMIGSMTFDIDGGGVFGDGGKQGVDPSLWDINVTSNLAGQFGRDAVGRLTMIEAPATPSYAIQGGGIDVSTGYSYTFLRSPAGATALSPVTTLLRSIDDNTIASNLGLGLTGRELANFSAVSAMSSTNPSIASLGRRVTALNLKLAAFAAIGSASQATFADGPITFYGRLAAVVERLIAGPVDFNDESAIRAILDRTSGALTSSAEGRAAAAQLLARYGAAVDTYLTAPASVAAIQHGMRLFVLPELQDILRTNGPDTSIVRAITTAGLLATFNDHSAIPGPVFATPASMGSIFSAPDFRTIGKFAVKDTIVLDANCNTSYAYSPICNDGGVGSYVGFEPSALTITAVRLPARFVGSIEVALAADGRIVMKRLNGAKDTVWFEYDVLALSGKRSSSRVYVRLGGEY